MREPRHGAHPPGAHLGHRLVGRSLVDAHLVDLLAPGHAAIAAADLRLRAQGATCHLHPRESLAAGAARDAVHARGELVGPAALRDQPREDVEQLRHALAAQGRPEQHGKDRTQREEPQDRAAGDRPALQVLVERALVRGGGLLSGDRVPGKQRRRVQAAGREPLGELGEKRLSAGVLQVALAHEDQRGDVVALEELPHGLGVALHAIVGAHHQDRRVECGHGALRLRGEVHVAGRVHEREANSLPVELGLRREDRDAALALHRVGVEVGAAVVHAPRGADGARGGEHGLRERGLARVHVGEKPNHRLPHPIDPHPLSSSPHRWYQRAG